MPLSGCLGSGASNQVRFLMFGYQSVLLGEECDSNVNVQLI